MSVSRRARTGSMSAMARAKAWATSAAGGGRRQPGWASLARVSRQRAAGSSRKGARGAVGADGDVEPGQLFGQRETQRIAEKRGQDGDLARRHALLHHQARDLVGHPVEHLGMVAQRSRWKDQGLPRLRARVLTSPAPSMALARGRAGRPAGRYRAPAKPWPSASTSARHDVRSGQHHLLPADAAQGQGALWVRARERRGSRHRCRG